MKIEIIHDADEKNYGERESLEISVNGKERIAVYNPEPEDASLCRDLSFAFQIVPLMREAWEAGKNGEPFDVENTEE